MVLAGAVTCCFVLPGGVSEALPFHAGSRPNAVAHDADAQLPAEWVAGDFGTPVAWNGTTLRIYADITDGERRFARNAVAVGGEFLIQPLVSYTPDTFYWMTDAVELADGSLLVAALEVINRLDLPQDGWQFEVVDTDVFVVRDPSSVKSWEIASKMGKIDDGWWDGNHVEFSDQYPGMAFIRDSWGALTGDTASYVVEYDPNAVADGTVGARMPDGDGVFAPVHTADGWFGMSWSWTDNTATLWSTDVLGGDWSEVETTVYDGQTHAHGLNVVDGVVVHRWSVFTARPMFEQIEL